MHPKKAFMIGALDKEIRLSFAQRIRGTLPEPYQALITEAKEKDTPDFKYNSDGKKTPTLNSRSVVLTKPLQTPHSQPKDESYSLSSAKRLQSPRSSR